MKKSNYTMLEQKVWKIEEVVELYHSPLLDLVYKAATVHRTNHNHNEVQISTLLSVKTGGCPEDCGYCPQAARYHTGVENEGLLSLKQVEIAAKRAKLLGSSRLCMGAAWRNVKDGKEFDQVVDMVRAVNKEGMEVCCTLGMLTEKQAQRLADAGLYAYNHNIDTSEEYYKKVISTRGYEDRLETIKNVRKSGVTVCSGGIIGMGESIKDRCAMLLTLANLSPQPESVPINALVSVEGTPMEDLEPIPIWDMIRMVATTRIVMPHTTVRLSAGRTTMSREGQAFCFMAGAASIFAGDKLLTTPNPDIYEDLEMFDMLGLKPTDPFAKHPQPETKEVADADQKERPKWSRPGHIIDKNVEFSKKKNTVQ
ncbi:MAG: biotin synthase [Maribacter sp.]